MMISFLKIFKRFIDKYIVEILIVYNQGKEKTLFSESRNYLSDNIYYKIQHLIRLLKERGKLDG